MSLTKFECLQIAATVLTNDEDFQSKETKYRINYLIDFANKLKKAESDGELPDSIYNK